MINKILNIIKREMIHRYWIPTKCHFSYYKKDCDRPITFILPVHIL